MRTTVSPSDEGKPVTKSFEIWDHGLCGTSNKSQESGQRTSGDFTVGADRTGEDTILWCSLGERATRKIA